MSEFIQNFVTSRKNVSDGNIRIGQDGRLWYDSITNTIRISDGVTPGGIIVSGGSGGGGSGDLSISNASDVNVSTLTNGSILIYNSSTSKWVASTTIETAQLEGGHY